MDKKDKNNLNELLLRRNMAIVCKKIADEANDKDAIQEYNKQLSNIDAKIEAITGRPPDVVVGLKPGILFGEVNNKE